MACCSCHWPRPCRKDRARLHRQACARAPSKWLRRCQGHHVLGVLPWRRCCSTRSAPGRAEDGARGLMAARLPSGGRLGHARVLGRPTGHPGSTLIGWTSRTGSPARERRGSAVGRRRCRQGASRIARPARSPVRVPQPGHRTGNVQGSRRRSRRIRAARHDGGGQPTPCGEEAYEGRISSQDDACLRRFGIGARPVLPVPMVAADLASHRRV
jgi:hypothetical protein